MGGVLAGWWGGESANKKSTPSLRRQGKNEGDRGRGTLAQQNGCLSETELLMDMSQSRVYVNFTRLIIAFANIDVLLLNYTICNDRVIGIQLKLDGSM